MDCSFTLLVGVFGVSNVGAVPPTGLLVVVPAPFLGDAIPRSNPAEDAVLVLVCLAGAVLVVFTAEAF